MRLIDADALSKAMYDEAFENDESYNETNPMARWDSGLWIRYKMFENILKEVPTIEPKQEWIPCSERLPEKEEVVLVCYKTTDTVHLCKYIGNGEVGEGLNDWWSYVDDCCAWNNVVLAWMPLPKPREGADNDSI